MELDRQHRLSNQTAVAAAVSCGGTRSARHGMNLDDDEAAGVQAAAGTISDEPPPPSYDEWLRLLQQKKFLG
ncbi:unnamed protein product, partial [Anisakis simplex]|uniref:Uncharacterized protein n=1 Tax=Anisakis simplex TaxID=6269 RepID=A0A0M3JGA7_ANISI